MPLRSIRHSWTGDSRIGVSCLHQPFVQGSLDREADGAIIERKAKRYGVRTFLDEVDLEGGDRIPATIKANLHACEEFVILLSPHSITRQWVLVELRGAWTLDKRIMAITSNLSADKVPDIIDHDKSYEFNEFDRYVNELIGRRKGQG
jgi:hypothetical protein